MFRRNLVSWVRNVSVYICTAAFFPRTCSRWSSDGGYTYYMIYGLLDTRVFIGYVGRKFGRRRGYRLSYYINKQLLISPCLTTAATTMDSRDTRQRRAGRRQSLRTRDATEAATGAIITPRLHPFRNTPQTRPHRKQPPVACGEGWRERCLHGSR